MNSGNVHKTTYLLKDHCVIDCLLRLWNGYMACFNVCWICLNCCLDCRRQTTIGFCFVEKGNKYRTQFPAWTALEIYLGWNRGITNWEQNRTTTTTKNSVMLWNNFFFFSTTHSIRTHDAYHLGCYIQRKTILPLHRQINNSKTQQWNNSISQFNSLSFPSIHLMWAIPGFTAIAIISG